MKPQEVCLLRKNGRTAHGARRSAHRARRTAHEWGSLLWVHECGSLLWAHGWGLLWAHGALRLGGESSLGARRMALGWRSLLWVLCSCALALRFFFHTDQQSVVIVKFLSLIQKL